MQTVGMNEERKYLCARCGKEKVPNEGELCWKCQLEAWKEEVELWEKEAEEVF